MPTQHNHHNISSSLANRSTKIGTTANHKAKALQDPQARDPRDTSIQTTRVAR